MGLLSAVSTELFPSRFHQIEGSGFVLSGQSGEGGIGRSKVRKAIKTIKKKGPAAIKKGAAVAFELAQAFGDADTRAKADKAKMAVDIARTAGNGRVYPGANLRKLVR